MAARAIAPRRDRASIAIEVAVRDEGLIYAKLARREACTRPRASAFGVDAYPKVEAKAVALLHSLARDPALVDGQKRLAWLATVAFLDLNGRVAGPAAVMAAREVLDAPAAPTDVGSRRRRP